MPSEAKFEKLNEIKYAKSKAICGLCSHFQGPPGGWGRCKWHSYEHEKHGTKQLGVHSYGGCYMICIDFPRARKILQSYADLAHES